MRKILILFLWLLVFSLRCVEAQEKLSFLTDKTTWCYYHYNGYAKIYEYYRYILDGDTVINNRTYKNMYKYSTETYNKATSEYITSIRKDNGIIYCPKLIEGFGRFMPVIDGETLLYDFTKEIGDIIKMSENPSYYFIVEDKDVLSIGDSPRTVLYFNNKLIWIEDIGILDQDFFNPLRIETNNIIKLYMYLEDGKILYGVSDFSFVAEGNHWVERITEVSDTTLYYLNTYYIKGDTLISEKFYKKLYKNDLYKGALRENIEHKIFYYEEGKPEILLNDFHWEMPRDYYFTNYLGNNFSINIVPFEVPKMKLADGKLYQYCDLDENPNPDGAPFKTLSDSVKLIRNIGLTAGIFKMAEVGKEEPSCYTDLVSFYNSKDELLYLNPWFDEKGNLTSINELSLESKVTVSQRHGEVFIRVSDSSNGNPSRIQVYRLDGIGISSFELMTEEVTLGSLPHGVYLYRLSNKDNTVFTGKFIVNN